MYREAIDNLSGERHISLCKRVKGMCDLLRCKSAHLCDQPNEILPINIQQLAFTSEHQISSAANLKLEIQD
jgi:hypothetical protein